MIRRKDGNDWLLISQVDHAHLAGTIASVWGSEHVLSLPVPNMLVPAVRDHDAGWLDWEESPQIDAETGRPRDFTEMPMPVATRIWSKSIDVCSQGAYSHVVVLERVRQYLNDQGRNLAHEQAALLGAILRFRTAFSADEVFEVANRSKSTPIGRETVEGTLDEFEAAEVVHTRRRLDGRPLYEVAVPAAGRSPLGGLWVSRHFCRLAETARAHRQNDPEERDAVAAFLEQQATLQQELNTRALKDYAGDELGRLIETGFRYVQFFDRVSLWLCCAPRDEPETMEIEGGPTVTFSPLNEHLVRVEPFPLSVDTLDVSVPACRIPARNYTDDAELHAALRDGGHERLEWQLVR